MQNIRHMEKRNQNRRKAFKTVVCSTTRLYNPGFLLVGKYRMDAVCISCFTNCNTCIIETSMFGEAHERAGTAVLTS
jgi:hypothetical protein